MRLEATESDFYTFVVSIQAFEKEFALTQFLRINTPEAAYDQESVIVLTKEELAQLVKNGTIRDVQRRL